MDQVAATERSDQDIHQDIVRALWDVPTVRNTNPPLSVQVQDGVVTISGIVRSRIISQQVHAAAASVAGVKRVRTDVENDASIELAVAQKLATDDQVRRWSPRIWVSAYHGDVRLEGQVPDRAIAERARELAASVTGVREVFNDLS
jgi:osmotically-inducible protein OsmY